VPHRILIVDDDPSTRFLYRRVLAKLGLEMDEVSSGDMALQYLHKRLTPPNLVVLDMLLPGASGTDVLMYIYTQAHLARTHVIIITAHQCYSAVGLRPGDRFFCKPVSLRAIRQAATEALQTPVRS
jgi:DNA-binding response OmpR family regulator